MTKDAATLIQLSDSDRMLADPAEDIRGREVRDKDGEDLGRVDDLLIDTDEGKVRMLRVEHGGILGFGATPSFIPVDAVTAVEQDAVVIDQSRDRVAGAPRYDPDTVDQREFYDNLYNYYGYLPYWSAGYLYPGFPYGR